MLPEVQHALGRQYEASGDAITGNRSSDDVNVCESLSNTIRGEASMHMLDESAAVELGISKESMLAIA